MVVSPESLSGGVDGPTSLSSEASVSSTGGSINVERGYFSGRIGDAVSVRSISGITPGGILSITRGICSTGV